MSELIQIGKKKRGSAARGRLYIKTFGCQMNVYDSEKLARVLEPRYEWVDSPEGADLIIVNTCSVRDKPEQKLYSFLGELRSRKAANPQLLIGVGGCVAQQEGDRIIKRSPEVDLVFGTHNLSLVPALIDLRRQGAAPQVAVDYREDWEELPLGLTERSRVSVFVSISRGCNKSCSYCIVPVTRGPEVSRDQAEIIREIRFALQRGAKEVVLLGQTVNSYGLDLQPRLRFSELLDRIAELPQLERIRFTSPHPQEVRSDFFDLIERNPKICRHIHMPLQSGSDRVLRLMNRNYRRKKYLGIVAELKRRVPDIAITTDLIVGFPGESEADFLDTLAVIEEVEFDSSFSFMFSPRPGTPAEALPEQLPHEVKLERLQRLQALQNNISSRRLAAWIGKSVEVLLDGPSASDPNAFQGRTSQNLVVNLSDAVPGLEPGMLVQVSVSAAGRHTLKGSIEPLQQAGTVGAFDGLKQAP